MAAKALSMKQQARKEASDLASRTLASFVPILGLGSLGSVTVYPSDSHERLGLGRLLLRWRNQRSMATTQEHQQWWARNHEKIGRQEEELAEELREMRGEVAGDSEGRRAG